MIKHLVEACMPSIAKVNDKKKYVNYVWVKHYGSPISKSSGFGL